MRPHASRLEKLEAERNADSVDLGVLFLPDGLSGDEQEAWIAERTTKTGTGPGVIVLPRKGSR